MGWITTRPTIPVRRNDAETPKVTALTRRQKTTVRLRTGFAEPAATLGHRSPPPWAARLERCPRPRAGTRWYLLGAGCAPRVRRGAIGAERPRQAGLRIRKE